MSRFTICVALVFLLTLPSSVADAQSTDASPRVSRSENQTDAPKVAVTPGKPNLITPTLGGKQVWGDELFYGQWRIQRNSLTDHCRLLDPQDKRHAWGTFAECRAALDKLIAERDLQPARGRVVVVLHGLMRSRSSMDALVKYLRANSNDTVLAVGYPSTQAAVGRHAQALASIVDNLPEATEIDFVAHSLGNLVVRRYLAEAGQSEAGIDKRIKRIVMIGPPNQGAVLAQTPGLNVTASAFGGVSGAQLAFGWEELERELSDAAVEVGIVAGGTGHSVGLNPLLSGDNDGVVRVAETRLEGAVDFTLVNNAHSLLILDTTTFERTLRFLHRGHFAENGARQPHPAPVDGNLSSE